LTKDNRLTNVVAAGHRSLLESDTWALMGRFGGHKRRFAAELERFGLVIGQEFMLAQLWREDGLSQSQLAERLGVSAPNVTKVVRGLERMGLVDRGRDDVDGRVVRVRLTRAGRALRDPVTEAWLGVESAILAEMSPAERNAYRVLAGRG
jgi:DNA-binding MarR family transcriptional regulator